MPLSLKTLELPIKGMDCTECTQHVQQALCVLPGVKEAQVYLASEKAVVRYDPAQVGLPVFQQAVEAAGYSVAQVEATKEGTASTPSLRSFTRPILTLFALVFGAVVLVVIVGEWLGWMERVAEVVPWYVGWVLVLLAGSPIFWNVLRASLRRQVISHTLMSLGVFAALAVGQWPTAAVVVFFMHTGTFAEHFTTERSRRALKHLSSLVPTLARVVRNGDEVEVPVDEVQVGDLLVVRPGEAIPVDGEVLSGQATIDQATLTGESMPVEVHPGSQVFAATLARLGSVRIRATHVGAETTFGKVIKLVEEAEAHRADVQRLADRFSSYFLPVVATIALLTFLISHNPLATASVLVVACSCSLALATPIAMLASIGMGAQRGLLIKGGKYLEILARADTLLIDKTGTITLGRPQITDIVPLDGRPSDDLLRIVASCERYSEHPLAEAVRREAALHGVKPVEPEHFEAVPGQGVRAQIEGSAIAVGNTHMFPAVQADAQLHALQAQGKTALVVGSNETVIGFIAAADVIRPDVKHALLRVRALGVKQIEVLTGDNEQTARAIASELGIAYRAHLLPDQKMAVVKQYQEQGHTVVMVGDGVNDAPALAQANVGIAMGAAGTDVALDAAHLALMREDWGLVPDAFAIAHRTMRVVKINLGFTVLYNLLGLTLAALGILPPIVAAAAQSLPDLGILANSAQLLRQLPAPGKRGSDQDSKPSFVERVC